MATDRWHLLDGENPDTLQLHDAAHWVRVYWELLRFKTQLLEQAQFLIREAGPAARTEIAQTDLLALDGPTKRLKSRFDFWKRRREELAGRPGHRHPA